MTCLLLLALLGIVLSPSGNAISVPTSLFAAPTMSSTSTESTAAQSTSTSAPSVGSGGNTTSCKLPDGNADNGVTQCKDPTGASLNLCCPSGTTCQSNGLCEKDASTYYRGSCIDWNGFDCPSTCKSRTRGGTLDDSTFDGQEVVVKGCGGHPGDNANFCCQLTVNQTSDCCIQGLPLFTLPVATETSIGTVSGTSSSTTATSTSTGTSAAPAATGTTILSASPSSGGLSKGAIAGIAVGAVALLAIIAIVAFLLWRKRRKNYKAVRSPTETQQLKRDMGMESMGRIGAGISAGATAGAGGIAAHQWHNNRTIESHNDMGHHARDHDDEAEAGMREMKPPERITEHPVDSMDSVASASRQRDIQDAADRELEEEGIRPFSPEDLEHGRDSPATGLMENRARDVSPER